jgi:hypothetical protein
MKIFKTNSLLLNSVTEFTATDNGESGSLSVHAVSSVGIKE